MVFVVHYVSILKDDERINYIRIIFRRSHTHIGEHVSKKIGNTFNRDVIVSSSNKPQALTIYLRLTLVFYAK